MTEFKQTTIRQTFGPMIKASIRLIEQVELMNGDVQALLWETEGGNWICETRNANPNYERVAVKACVIRDDDRPFQVMEFLDWSTLARAMQKKRRWKFVIEVE